MEIDEILEHLDELKDLKAKLDLDLKNTEKEIKKMELCLQSILEKQGTDSMTHGNYTFGWVEKSRKAFSQSAFSQVYPELFEKFKLETISKKFECKLNK